MGTLVFILFCLGVLVGVILLIVYFSMPGKEKEESTNKAIVIKARGGTEMSVYDDPNMPKNFDETFFKERIIKIRGSSNLVHDLFTAWETKFKSKQEKKILREIEDWYKHIKNISDAEAEALMARMDADDARTDYATSKTEEYQEARKKRRILTVQADNADLEARKREAEARGRPPEKTAPEETKKKRPSEEEVRQRKVSRFHTVTDDAIAIDEAQAQKLRELDERESNEIEEVENNVNLSSAEKQKRLEEIDARYLNLRKKILTTTGGLT